MDRTFKKALELMEKGESFVLITVVDSKGSSPATPGKRLIILPDGNTEGTIGGGNLEKLAIQKGMELFSSGGTLLETITLTEEEMDMGCGGEVTLFYECSGNADRVFIFGGGHIGKVLAEILNTAGFQVNVIDPREMETGGFVHYRMDYTDFFRENKIPDKSYVVIATPSHTQDYQVLEQVYINSNPIYIGVVASRRKISGFVKRLKETLKEVHLENLYSPAGLDIGGSSPEEIAISIAAEIQTVRYKKEGNRHLKVEWSISSQEE